mgnify:CR=1 FL=1
MRRVLKPGGVLEAMEHVRALARKVPPVPPERATTLVTQIYPSADVLPENTLKFYVHFSAPMSRGHSYDHIRLLDEANRPVELAFLELAEELWSPDMLRLTLLMDPGRIKRGDYTLLVAFGAGLTYGSALIRW